MGSKRFYEHAQNLVWGVEKEVAFIELMWLCCLLLSNSHVCGPGSCAMGRLTIKQLLISIESHSVLNFYFVNWHWILYKPVKCCICNARVHEYQWMTLVDVIATCTTYVKEKQSQPSSESKLCHMTVVLVYWDHNSNSTNWLHRNVNIWPALFISSALFLLYRFTMLYRQMDPRVSGLT